MAKSRKYKPGMVSGLLFMQNNKEEKNILLENIFSKSKNEDMQIQSTNDVQKTFNFLSKAMDSKKTKRKKKSTRAMSDTDNNAVSVEPPPFLHETLLPKKENSRGVKRKLEKDENNKDEVEGKRPRRNRQRDKHADKRTLFVGNCPLTADRKTLRTLFKEFGEIESIRFRCAPPADPNLPKRATVITKSFHEKCNNFVAYVVFKEEDSAKKALIRNGYLLDDLHIRVDIAALSKKHDKKRSVFVGNLPFTVSEEAIRQHFEDCGEITNVRIVRDRATSLGKGICYVQFESKDSVSLAVKLNNSELEGRQIRVMLCSSKQKKIEQQKKANKSQQASKDGDEPKVKKLSFGPSNKSKESFKAVLKAKKEKRFRKLKKKKEKAKKTDGLSSIYGNIAPAQRTVKNQKAKGQSNKAKNKGKGLKAKKFKTSGK